MNKNAKDKELLEEAYTSIYEAVGHYDTHVRLQRGGRWNAHTVNVRKTDKELIKKFLDQGFRIVKPGEEDNEHTFGNIEFEPRGKDHNGAEAFRVYKDGSYVLYATMFGPRQTVTLLADPKEYAGPATAHKYPASPADSLALTQFDRKQVPGGLERVAALLGASEEDNESMSNLEALISSSANEDGELKLDDETDAAEFEINKTQY